MDQCKFSKRLVHISSFAFKPSILKSMNLLGGCPMLNRPFDFQIVATLARYGIKPRATEVSFYSCHRHPCELGDIHPDDFKVAEDLFYVDVKLRRVYLQKGN